MAAVGGPTREQTGFYCSTSGTYFTDKESLSEHYKSDFHRYNLKRKVAGLPPVSKEWFEARKAQLTSATTTPHQKIWFDPLTRKKFMSENTYLAHVNSKRYQDLVKRSSVPAPEPVITLKKLETDGAPAGPIATPAKPAAGYTVTPLSSRVQPTRQAAAEQDSSEEGDEEVDGSGWETASEDGEAATAAEGGSSEEWEEWDVRRSLFDNHVSNSLQDNLEYMYKSYGFYLPDAEFLADPEGLIKYLGEKLQYGKVPLHTAGDDPNAKEFRSLHAVQRHMVDTNQCKMLYDGNEEEYEEFYDYSKAEDEAGAEEGAAAAGKQLLAAGSAGVSASTATGGYELVLGEGAGARAGAGASKVLGNRELSRYYKQRPRPEEGRESILVNTLLAKYRALGIETRGQDVDAGVKRAQRWRQHEARSKLNLAMRTNINNNLPKNVTY